MEIIIASLSIWFLTGLVWGARRTFGIRPCPICAGVAGTWLWILAGIYIGWLEADSWRLITALAMGGSVVGAAYQLEKKLPAGKSSLLWKVLFIPAGFIAAHALTTLQWTVFAITIIALGALAFFFLRSAPISREKSNTTVEELEDKMKNCC